jgi:hypothetical protein
VSAFVIIVTWSRDMLSIFKTPSQIACVVFEIVALNVMYRRSAQEFRHKTDTG